MAHVDTSFCPCTLSDQAAPRPARGVLANRCWARSALVWLEMIFAFKGSEVGV